MGNSLVPSIRVGLGEGDLMIWDFLCPKYCVVLGEGVMMIGEFPRPKYFTSFWGGGYDACGIPSSPSIRVAFGEGGLMIGEWFF